MIGSPSRSDNRSEPAATADCDSAAPDAWTDALAMGLLQAHIPLTLLLDLAETFGPPSQQILESETDVADPPGEAGGTARAAWWRTPQSSASHPRPGSS